MWIPTRSGAESVERGDAGDGAGGKAFEHVDGAGCGNGGLDCHWSDVRDFRRSSAEDEMPWRDNVTSRMHDTEYQVKKLSFIDSCVSHQGFPDGVELLTSIGKDGL